jgi:HK97 family phage portal protein
LNILGFEITRKRAVSQNLQSVWNSPWNWQSLWGRVDDPTPGDWQRNITLDNTNSLLSFSAVFCCITGIASDIAKNRIKLSENVNGIWTELERDSPFLPVIRKPNDFQNRIQFLEHWIISKLEHGNAYILLERDQRGIVRAMYVLNPCHVRPLISESGMVFYELQQDYLNQVDERIIVPASEIIHDRMNTLWHPLIGVSPLYACALSVLMGNKIQTNSTQFFANRSLPGGMLTAPGRITDETAQRMKQSFEEKFSGTNLGRLFVGGDGLKFEPFTMTAEQADLVEQLKWAVADVARAFHYPEFKLGGPLPPYAGNMQALTLSYYTDCLQILIESVEQCLDEGLSLPSGLGTELDVDNLLRMDTAALYESNNKAVGGGWMEPNEARFKANYGPVTGGNTPYLQQQNYSLAALAKRDAQADPFASKSSAPPPAPPDPQPARSFEEDYDVEEYAAAELVRFA